MKGFLCTLAAAALLVTPTLGAAQNLPAKFEPSRDAAKDVTTAVAAAKAQGKRVLVDVGGEWCSWCHVLDRFVAANPDVQAQRDAGYVWVKVNWTVFSSQLTVDMASACSGRRIQRRAASGLNSQRRLMRRHN